MKMPRDTYDVASYEVLFLDRELVLHFSDPSSKSYDIFFLFSNSRHYYIQPYYAQPNMLIYF